MDDVKIAYKGTLKTLQIENLLIKTICEQIRKDFNNIDEVMLNMDLINEICNAIEEISSKKKLKVVKLDLFFKIYGQLFGMMSLDKNKEYLKTVVDYLHLNSLIKKRTFFQKVVIFVKKLLLQRAKN